MHARSSHTNTPPCCSFLEKHCPSHAAVKSWPFVRFTAFVFSENNLCHPDRMPKHFKSPFQGIIQPRTAHLESINSILLVLAFYPCPSRSNKREACKLFSSIIWAISNHLTCRFSCFLALADLRDQWIWSVSLWSTCCLWPAWLPGPKKQNELKESSPTAFYFICLSVRYKSCIWLETCLVLKILTLFLIFFFFLAPLQESWSLSSTTALKCWHEPRFYKAL